MGKVIKFLILIFLLAGLAYVGACVYANFFAVSQSTFNGNVPTAEEAPYMVVIENTGNAFFVKSYDQYGQVIVLHGYWERIGNDFKYRDKNLILDQAIYGGIRIHRR